MGNENTRIYRSEKQKNYSVVNNEVFKRKDISYRAKGIMAYILTLPDDWKIYLDEVRTHGTEGRDAFRSAWKELEEKGYIERVQDRTGGKFSPAKTYVHETSRFPPCTGKPSTVKPCTEKPRTDNPTLLSTNNTKYLNKQNTNGSTTPTTDINNNNIYSKIQQEFGRVLSPIETQTIEFWQTEDNFSPELIDLALREAVLSQAYNLKYIQSILIRWEKANITTPQQAQADRDRRNKAKAEKYQPIPELVGEPRVPLFNYLDPENQNEG